MVHRREKMELHLFNTLNDSKNISLRRAAILKVMVNENSPTVLIVPYLKIKYNIIKDITV